MVAAWLKDEVVNQQVLVLIGKQGIFKTTWLEQLLAVYFDIPAEGYGQFMTTAEISDKLVIKGSIKKPMSLSRLGMVLQQQGFKSKRYGKTRTRGWIIRERDTEEVNANRNIEGHG